MRRSKILAVFAAVLILSASGAAASTILQGYVDGNVKVDVAPPLHIQTPFFASLPPGTRNFASIDAEKTSFRAVAEVAVGNTYFIKLPILNPSTADTRARLDLTYPNCVAVIVTGSGIINELTAISFHAWNFTAKAGAMGTDVNPFDGLKIQVTVLEGFAGTSVEIAGSVTPDSGLHAAFAIPLPDTTPTSGNTFFLHNNPHPAQNDTNSQANLPMDTYSPNAGTLFNYDKDRDTDPGRLVLHSSANATEGDLSLYQNWTMPVSGSLVITNNVTLSIYSAARNFEQTRPGTLIVFLRDMSNGEYTEIGSVSATSSPWQQGSTTWVRRDIRLTGLNYTVPSGHTLEVKLMVGPDSADMWFAYDTTAYPSSLTIGRPTQTIPGGDSRTYYLANNPTPPTGNTPAQANLTMTGTLPTATTLYNYDTAHDSSPGRRILAGGLGVNEDNLSKYQNWQAQVNADTLISGDVRLVLWSATRDFSQNQLGVVLVFLRDHNGTGYSEIAQGSLYLFPWQQGDTGWVERTIVIPNVNYTVAAGHKLEVKVVVPTGSYDIWTAYDTSAFPSRLVLP